MAKFHKILILNFSLLLLAVFVSGCWDAKDIDQKQIATAIAFDFKDGEIWGYIELANIEGSNKSDTSAGSSGEKYIYIKGHGKTLNEVRDDLDNQLHKPKFLSSISAVILSENFAKSYLLDFLYYFRANEFYRKKGRTVVIQDAPEELLKALHTNDNSVGLTIDDLINALDDTGKSFSRTNARLIDDLSSQYTGILIPCVGLHNVDLALTGYSVVNGTKVDGFIPVPAKGLVFLKADQPKLSYTMPYNENILSIDVSLTKRRIKTSYEGEAITFHESMEFKAELISGNKKIPYGYGDAEYDQIGKALEDMLMQELGATVSQAQNEFQCDYLQFDDEFRINYPVAFEGMDWQKEFVNANINFEVNVDMSASWMMDYGSYPLK